MCHDRLVVVGVEMELFKLGRFVEDAVLRQRLVHVERQKLVAVQVLPNHSSTIFIVRHTFHV